jgi:hypothetical protein
VEKKQQILVLGWGAGRGGATKDILKQLSQNLQNFKIHGRFFLSYFLWKRKISGSEDSRALFMPLSLSFSLSHTHARARLLLTRFLLAFISSVF